MKRFGFAALLAVAALAGLLWLVWPDDAPGVGATGAPEEATSSAGEASVAHRPRGGRVSGTVFQQGRPVAKARVTLRATAALVAYTLDDGGFLFDEVPPGAIYLSATAPGAASEVIGPLQLVEGGRLDGLTLVLNPAVRVQGQVVDLITRRPIEGATVIAADKLSRTDAQGRFTLEGPKAQTWLEISAPGFLSRTEWVSLELALSGGRLELVLTPAGRLEGQVTENGTPVAGATVWAEQVDGAHRGERSMTVFTDKTGQFLVECTAGTLRLTAVTPSGTRVKGPLLRVAVGERKTGLQLETGEATWAEGVVTRGGAPLVGAQLSAVDAATEEPAAFAVSGPTGRFRFDSLLVGRYVVQVRLGGLTSVAGPFEHTGDGRLWNVAVAEGGVLEGRVEPAAAGVLVRWRGGLWAGPSAETVTDAQGHFRFEGLPDELVSVDAEGPTGAATARAKPGDTLVLSLRRGPVIAHLQDDTNAPVTDGVLLAHNLETGAVQRHLVLAPDGVARFELPAGPWELTLEVSGRGRSSPVGVRVTEAGAEVRLSLETSVVVEGIVRDASTQLPIQGASVEAISGPVGREARVSVLTDARGGFLLPPVPRSGKLLVRRQGFAPQWREAFQGSRWDVALVPDQRAKDEPSPFQFEGVGMVLEPTSPVRVAQVNEGGPAERAGVRAGDLILAVEGEPTAGRSLNDVVNRIRGPAGTPVRLRFEREGRTFELTIRRRLLAL